MIETVALAVMAALLASGFVLFSWAAVDVWRKGMPYRLVSIGWGWTVWMICVIVIRLVGAK